MNRFIKNFVMILLSIGLALNSLTTTTIAKTNKDVRGSITIKRTVRYVYMGEIHHDDESCVVRVIKDLPMGKHTFTEKSCYARIYTDDNDQPLFDGITKTVTLTPEHPDIVVTLESMEPAVCERYIDEDGNYICGCSNYIDYAKLKKSHRLHLDILMLQFLKNKGYEEVNKKGVLVNFPMLESSIVEIPVKKIGTSESSKKTNNIKRDTMSYLKGLYNNLSSNNKFQTLININKVKFCKDCVMIASIEDYADALCTAPLAKKYNASLLLVPKNNIPKNVLDRIVKFKTKKVYIIGGTGAISKNVENTLISKNIKCTRIAGKDRYDTSVKIAKKIGTNNGVVVTTGLNYPDALSIASIASMKQMPILLSPKNSLPLNVSNYLKDKSIPKSYLIGGTGILSDKVKSSLPNCKRISGKDRYDTNIKVLQEFEKELNFKNIYMATGRDYPDALVGSVLASIQKAPVILTDKVIHPTTTDYLKTKKITIITLLSRIIAK